jgi:hypothetical protein
MIPKDIESGKEQCDNTTPQPFFSVTQDNPPNMGAMVAMTKPLLTWPASRMMMLYEDKP